VLALASHSSCEFIVKKCGRSGPYREVCNIFWRMLNRKAPEIDALGRGVYSAAEALRLINFSEDLALMLDALPRAKATLARYVKVVAEIERSL